MLIRFVTKNIFSFKVETEFNLFPNKTERLSHHKVTQNGIDFLRLSAIYGANGSGKSNLIKSISLLESLVKEGKLKDDLEDVKFKLSQDNTNMPVSLGIEFYAKSKIYYYSITFDKGVILNESLAESKKDIDVLIFDRTVENNIQSVRFFDGYTDDVKNKLFVEVLAEKLLQKDELLLSFLHAKYSEEFIDAKIVFDWFDTTLVIIEPNSKPKGIAHILDIDSDLNVFANSLIPLFNTGINKISVEKEKMEDANDKGGKNDIKNLFARIKKQPDFLSVLSHKETGEEITVVNENGDVFIKKIVTTHVDDKGSDVAFSIGMESDGTKRLIDYIPALNGIINEERVYIIDEIERSIHPITIKEIISKISLDKFAKGQLVFTTHESCLLDQDILRPDEIWFAQKDIDGASRLYSLSDFKIHNTANIENGYLNGRFGGIPFLSNLQDLNWHKHDEVFE